MLKWMASAYIRKHLCGHKVEKYSKFRLEKPHYVLLVSLIFFLIYPKDRYIIVLIKILLKSTEADLREQLVICEQRTH